MDSKAARLLTLNDVRPAIFSYVVHKITRIKFRTILWVDHRFHDSFGFLERTGRHQLLCLSPDGLRNGIMLSRTHKRKPGRTA